jgi:hypothetical protein
MGAETDNAACTYIRECIAAGKKNFIDLRGPEIVRRQNATFEGKLGFQDFSTNELIYWGTGMMRYVSYRVFDPSAYQEAHEQYRLISNAINGCDYGEGKPNHYLGEQDESMDWYLFMQEDDYKKPCYYTITVSLTKVASGNFTLSLIVIKTMT